MSFFFYFEQLHRAILKYFSASLHLGEVHLLFFNEMKVKHFPSMLLHVGNIYGYYKEYISLQCSQPGP